MNDILIPVLIFVGLGLVSGVLLTVFSKVFAVHTDERIEQVQDLLPGLNCGVCGNTGCANYAEQIVNHDAPINKCIPGGDETSRKISELLGRAFEDVIEQIAYVRCGGVVPEATEDKYIYQGEASCAACNMYYQGKGKCSYSCLGLGDCVKVCQYGAISIENEIAVIDPKKCKGCQMCVAACPNHLIHIRADIHPVYVQCSSCNTGKDTVQSCKNGCIGCGKCERSCPNGAITVSNHLASIDYDKCTGCGICAQECPRHCIVSTK